MRRATLAGALALAIAAAAGHPARSLAQTPLDRISHVVVLYLENRSFDSLFGEFPGADGLAAAAAAPRQRDKGGHVYETLPAAPGPFARPGNPEEIRSLEVLDGLPNTPFRIPGIRPGVTAETYTRDLIHAFYTNRTQIDGGRNDLFAAYSDAKGLSMGYYAAADLEKSRLWSLAQHSLLLDHFFMGTFGGSFLNHMWLACACAPVWPDPPNSQRSEVDAAGRVVAEKRVTARGDGDFAVNTAQSIFLNDGRQSENVLPPQHQVTIGDRLTAKGVDWAWYSGGWSLATKSGRTPEEDETLKAQAFQWHHQPFAAFSRFDPTTQSGRDERTRHLRDAAGLADDIRNGTLPPVTFYKPIGVLNQHPGYARLGPADEEAARIADLLAQSPMRDSYALIITYDENGGFYDHVAPPAGPSAGSRADFFGPGSRVPAIVVSPLAPRGQVDHTTYETTSILKLIGDRFRLDPLPSARYGAVESLSRVFGGPEGAAK